MAKTELTGKRVGILTVTEYLGVTAIKKAVWRAVCDCGNSVVVMSQELRTGDTKSCGCLKAEATRRRNREAATHQRSRSTEYKSWNGMKQRCYNKQSKDFPRYGGRGISVCPEWYSSFEAFANDMGPKPTPDHSLDRIDTNGNYEPGNCRWALPVTQATNRRSTVLVDGKSIAQWARELGVTHGAVRKRLQSKGNVYGADA